MLVDARAPLSTARPSSSSPPPPVEEDAASSNAKGEVRTAFLAKSPGRDDDCDAFEGGAGDIDMSSPTALPASFSSLPNQAAAAAALPQLRVVDVERQEFCKIEKRYFVFSVIFSVWGLFGIALLIMALATLLKCDVRNSVILKCKLPYIEDDEDSISTKILLIGCAATCVAIAIFNTVVFCREGNRSPLVFYAVPCSTGLIAGGGAAAAAALVPTVISPRSSLTNITTFMMFIALIAGTYVCLLLLLSSKIDSFPPLLW